MANFVFSNFAVTSLEVDIGSDDVILETNSEDSYRFPGLISGVRFPLVLADSDDIFEIVYVTSVSPDGIMSVERGQEGTQAQSWLAGTLCRHTFTAATVIAAAGLRPRGTWNNVSVYSPGDIVVQGGISYVAVITNSNSVPTSVNGNWQVVYQPPGASATAMNWQGAWNSGTTYAQGHVVSYAGRIWQANGASTNSIPAVGNANWIHIAKWSGNAWYSPIISVSGQNNYVATIAGAEAPVGLYDGLTLKIRVGLSNSDSLCTLQINAFPAKPFRPRAGLDFAVNALTVGEAFEVTYLLASDEFVALKGPGDTANLNALAAAIASIPIIPSGIMVAFGGNVQPAGWLFCDGSEFLRTGAGLALFNVIGTTYGVGNGSTTANLPDLRGRVPVGAPGATGRIPTGYFGGFSSLAVGAVGGQAIHSLEETELPPHVHTLTDPGHGHSQTQSTHLHTYNRPTVSYTVNAGVQQAVWTAAVTSDTTSPNNANVSAIAANFTGITMGSIGSGLDFNIMQPSLLINTYIIKL